MIASAAEQMACRLSAAAVRLGLRDQVTIHAEAGLRHVNVWAPIGDLTARQAKALLVEAAAVDVHRPRLATCTYVGTLPGDVLVVVLTRDLTPWSEVAARLEAVAA